MEPKTRNRGLMIGGGIIALLLLLVCGPLEGKFGTKTEQKTPDVAAGPPAGNISAAAGVAAAGAAAGAAIGESDIAGAIERRDAAARELDSAYGEGVDAGRGAATDAMAAAGSAASGAGAVIGAGATGAAIASATAGSGSGTGAGLSAPAGVGAAGATASGAARATGGSMRGSPPSVSAGVPIDSLPTVAAAPVSAGPSGPSAAELAAAAANEFDVAVAGIATSGIGLAGKVVDRFAPPVESGPVNSPLRLTQADAFGAGVLRPCDSPGAGCRNLSAIAGGGGDVSVNPPIGSLLPPGVGGPQ